MIIGSKYIFFLYDFMLGIQKVQLFVNASVFQI